MNLSPVGARRPLIKICGITTAREADYLNAAMPDYAGFVFAPHRLQITPAQAQALRERLSPKITAVGVFVDEEIDGIIRLIGHGTIDMVQLHGSEDEDYIIRLKSLTDKPIIKAVTVRCRGDTQRYAHSCADYILFDSGQASGKTFDWDLIGENCRKINIGTANLENCRKFFLAGGLNIENILPAIEKTAPYAVDISSGVETNGQKDEKKIIELIRRIRNEQ